MKKMLRLVVPGILGFVAVILATKGVKTIREAAQERKDSQRLDGAYRYQDEA